VAFFAGAFLAADFFAGAFFAAAFFAVAISILLFKLININERSTQHLVGGAERFMRLGRGPTS
jgi:hypothetical protein